MSGKKKLVEGNQRNIKSFFNQNGKRAREEKREEKLDKSQRLEGTLDSPPLSPEQRKRMDEKRMEALSKLQQNHSSALNVGPTWSNALKEEFSKDYFQKLMQFVASERKKATIYPPEHDVFSWTRLCAINDVKVVIIGQDPYHGPKQAHGLCFSVQVGVGIPPSLVNMYKELEQDITNFKIPSHGYLVGWAKQGVLLLNAVLTVEASKANSHKDRGWERFTDATINWINRNLEGVVFILWGGYAQKKGNIINKSRHLVLTAPHPSPLSVYRGFFGCKHFSKANEYLKNNGKNEIDWCHLPTSI